MDIELCFRIVVDIPDGEDTSGLGKASLFLDTTDLLLEDGRNLSRGSLSLSVSAGLDGGCVESSWCSNSSLRG